MITTNQNEGIKHLLNGTLHSLQTVLPLSFEIGDPAKVGSEVKLEFGVLIGLTGDIKGNLVFGGSDSVFSRIGESMYGMKLDGEMLSSFSGELGNMVVGNLSTFLFEKGIKTEITHPTILKGQATLSGYEKAIQIQVSFDQTEHLKIYFLVD